MGQTDIEEQSRKLDALISDVHELRAEMRAVRQHQSLLTTPMLDGKTMLDLIRDAVIAEQKRNSRMQVFKEARGAMALVAGVMVAFGVFRDNIVSILRGMLE